MADLITPSLIGFVLASGMENYLYQAVQFDGWAFLTKPGVITIGAITLVSIFFTARHLAKSREAGHKSEITQHQEKHPASKQLTALMPQLVFTAMMWSVFAYSLYDAMGVSMLARTFPASLCVLVLLLTSITFVTLLRSPSSDPINYDSEASLENRPTMESLFHYIYWVAGMIAGCYVIGYVLSLAIFFILFLRIKAHATWARTLILTSCAQAFMIGLSHLMILDLPTGLLQDAVSLPWPLG